MRKFTDAEEALAHLLDRYELHEAAQRLICHVDHEGFRSVKDYDRFAATMRRAADTGAVALRLGSGARKGQIVAIKLANPAQLYQFLGRTAARDEAARLITVAAGSLQLDPCLEARLPDVEATWARNTSWRGIDRSRAIELQHALRLAQGILEGRHEGLDYRTFSRRACADSKALERVEAAVVELLRDLISWSPGLRPRDALASLGLEKVSQPLLVSGPVAVGGVPITRAQIAYLGLPPNRAQAIELVSTPTYLLTVENFTSFHRHATEVNSTGEGLVVFTGGFPSKARQAALKYLFRLTPSVPLFHWSDIDVGGLGIFRAIESLAERQVRPHLMSIELAERYGSRVPEKLSIRPGAVAGSPIAVLWDYLANPEAKWLEQEELDPELPSIIPNSHVTKR